ncbi:hypothetical protein RJ639_029493, partial [Escallonia herrerae]
FFLLGFICLHMISVGFVTDAKLVGHMMSEAGCWQKEKKKPRIRSFVTCDDPKGVVECRTIRKSKTESQKVEGKVESTRIPKFLNRSLSCKEGREEMVSRKGTSEEFHIPSSFQLVEVSRGAQKLNHVIDSWSKGMSFEGQSKDIAKDLLKGALDLQESLVMLGKLQEASKYMAKLKTRQKDEVPIERTTSNRFGNDNYQMGSQNPRLSVDGSSRDCYEELREVIRDNFARQNILPNGSLEHKAFSNRKKLDLSPDMPSTSSSRSSRAFSRDFTFSDCSSSSKVPEEKAKGSNLIAKLMGLEEIPLRPLQPVPRKQLERDKILKQRRPFFDIDMPKERKPEFVVRKLDHERMSLDEIIEVMQFKGLRKSSKHQTYYPNASHLEKGLSYDAPPIVLMKPSRPALGAEELRTRTSVPKEGLGNDEMRSWKLKEEVPFKIREHSSGALNSHEMRKKLPLEETPIKKIRQEKGVKDSQEVLAKQEDKVARIKKRSSLNKMRASVPVSPKPEKATTPKKVDKIQKVILGGINAVKLEKEKSTKTDGQGKIISTKKKPEKGTNITRNHIPQQKSSTSNSILKRATSSISQNSRDQKEIVKNEKPVCQILVESTGLKDDDMQNDLTCNTESQMEIPSTKPAMQFLTEEEPDASEILSKDNCGNHRSSLFEAPPLTTQHESSTGSLEEAHSDILHNITDSKCCETRTNLLLSSPSFLNHAGELFDINEYEPLVLQTTGLYGSGSADSKLFLDCANELLEHRSLRQTRSMNLLLQNATWKSRFYISKDQLAGEVRKGIENLRSYGKLAAERPPADTVYAMLERDIWCKGMEGGAWDFGWSDGYTVAEVEIVVADLDKLVLSELLEEVFKEHVL